MTHNVVLIKFSTIYLRISVAFSITLQILAFPEILRLRIQKAVHSVSVVEWTAGDWQLETVSLLPQVPLPGCASIVTCTQYTTTLKLEINGCYINFSFCEILIFLYLSPRDKRKTKFPKDSLSLAPFR